MSGELHLTWAQVLAVRDAQFKALWDKTEPPQEH
jgi:hypothetical protein